MTDLGVNAEYGRMSAADLHRERARLLRIVVLQRWVEMKVAVSNAAERSVAVIMADADCGMYERILRLDAELEKLAETL